MSDEFILECEGNDTFEDILEAVKTHIVDVIVLGGWVFTGRVVAIDELVILRDVIVTASGGLTVSTFEVPNVSICPDSIISLGKPILITG